MHLGSLESTQETRVALGYHLKKLLCFASIKSMKLTMWLAVVVLNKYMKFLGKIVPFTLLSQYSGKVGD